MESATEVIEYIISLSKSTILGSKLNLQNINIEMLLEMAKAHKLDNLLYLSLKQYGFDKLTDDIIYNLRKSYKHAVAIDAGQDYHLSIVKEALENKWDRLYCVERLGYKIAVF